MSVKKKKNPEKPGHEWEYNGPSMSKGMVLNASPYRRDIHGDHRTNSVSKHNWKCKKCGEVTATDGTDPPSRDWTPKVFQTLDGSVVRPPTCEETIVKQIQES